MYIGTCITAFDACASALMRATATAATTARHLHCVRVHSVLQGRVSGGPGRGCSAAGDEPRHGDRASEGGCPRDRGVGRPVLPVHADGACTVRCQPCSFTAALCVHACAYDAHGRPASQISSHLLVLAAAGWLGATATNRSKWVNVPSATCTSRASSSWCRCGCTRCMSMCPLRRRSGGRGSVSA